MYFKLEYLKELKEPMIELKHYKAPYGCLFLLDGKNDTLYVCAISRKRLERILKHCLEPVKNSDGCIRYWKDNDGNIYRIEREFFSNIDLNIHYLAGELKMLQKGLK